MKVSKECELGNFYVDKHSDCENCRSIPFEITWSNGLTFYCLDCAENYEEFEEPTDELLDELKKLRNRKLMDMMD